MAALITSPCSRVAAMRMQTLAMVQVGSGGKEANGEAKARMEAGQEDPAPSLDGVPEASKEAASSRGPSDLAIVMATSEVCRGSVGW